MMGGSIRKDSATEIPASVGSVAMEYNDEEYIREVLQFKPGHTEALYDGNLVQQAEKLGIVIARPLLPDNYKKDVQKSLSESADTATTYHVRTGSSGSLESASTGITSRSSFEHQINPLRANPIDAEKRPEIKRDLSFSEYEKYLLKHQPAESKASPHIPPPIPSEPAPSLFSVSTKKSYSSIKNGFKTKFRLGRSKKTQEELK